MVKQLNPLIWWDYDDLWSSNDPLASPGSLPLEKISNSRRAEPSSLVGSGDTGHPFPWLHHAMHRAIPAAGMGVTTLPASNVVNSIMNL
jgi:hypothetical protein